MSLADIDTPALLLDLDVVERNIATMAKFFADKNANLRPHFKTPKCPQVARLQLQAGAIGITCAKLGEAFEIAAAGIETSVLIANQIVGRTKTRRLIELAQRLPEIIVAVDDIEQVLAIDAELSGAGTRVGALIEADIGMQRCGTDTPEQSVELARAIRATRVEYRGLMGYEGHAVLIADAAKRTELAGHAVTRLLEHRNALVDAGFHPEIVSAGGTGTHDISGVAAGVTEIQAGSYVFMDGTYTQVRSEFDPALTVLTTVLRRRGRTVITDCGMKALSHEFGMPRGVDLPLRYVALSEEHGHVRIDEDAEVDLAAGDTIRILPSHGDTTINLHDVYHVMRGEQPEAIWPITARGKFL